MRRKTKKMRGKKTAGYGSRKKHRGKGSRGGKGMAGTGKRADQKKSFILAKIGKEYYGKRGFIPPQRKKGREINLDQLSEMLSSFLEKGYAKKGREIEIDLKKAGYTKLLGRGGVKEKYLINVRAFSKKAKEKIEEMGGKIIGMKESEKTGEPEKQESKGKGEEK